MKHLQRSPYEAVPDFHAQFLLYAAVLKDHQDYFQAYLSDFPAF